MTAPLVVGNWKMHGTQSECRDLARGVARGLKRKGRQIALKGLGKSAIDNFEIAYEPVWAIGTGLNAASEQIARVHGRIGQFLKASFGNRKRNAARILYGRGVKPENAAAILRTPGVNGLLVGGTSLKAETFLPIVNCLS